MTLALFYLREVLGYPVPEDTLGRLWERTRSNPDDYYRTLLLGHPRHAHSLLGRAGRRLFKARHGAQVRAATGDADPGAALRIKMRKIRRPARLPDAAPALRHRLPVLAGRGGAVGALIEMLLRLRLLRAPSIVKRELRDAFLAEADDARK